MNLTKPRVFITTDVGGSDPDDIQSLAHLLWYSDLLDIVGISCGHPNGKVRVAKNVISAYKQDYKRHRFELFGLVAPPDVEAVCYGGSTHEASWALSTGSRKLIKASWEKEPLLVLVWGACTDLAAAIKHGAHRENITAHIIASWNREKDPRSFEVVKQSDIKKVINESTFRGMYLGAGMSGRMGNRGFVETVVRPCGELGKLFWEISANINVGRYSLKAGDTGSTLWALDKARGPGAVKWGGLYPDGTDSTKPEHKLGVFKGAGTIARARRFWLGNWIDRLEKFYGHS